MQGRADAADHDVPNAMTLQDPEYFLRLEAGHSALPRQDPCAMSPSLEVQHVEQEPQPLTRRQRQHAVDLIRPRDILPAHPQKPRVLGGRHWGVIRSVLHQEKDSTGSESS